MKPIDYVIIGVMVIAVAFSIFTLVRNKKKGKNSCGCDCKNCRGCYIQKENKIDK